MTNPKKYYATKKRVSRYIKDNTRLFTDKTEFVGEIDRAVLDLLECDGEKHNPNQLRFFRRVKLTLEKSENKLG